MTNLSKVIGVSIRRWKSSPVLRNSSSALILRITGAILLFVFNYLAVKMLGVSDSGTFFLAIAIVNISSTLLLLGLDQYTLRRLSSSLKESVKRPRVTLIAASHLIVASSILGILIFVFISPLLSRVFKVSELSSVLIILCLSLPFLNMNMLIGEALKAKKKFVQSVLIETNSLYLVTIPILGLLWVLGKSDINWFSLFFVLGTIICLLISILIFHRSYHITSSRTLIKPLANREYSSTAKNSYHLFWVSALYLSMTWMDILIVGFFLPPDQVSVYSIASKIAKLMTFPLFAINTIVAPRISAHFSKGDTKLLNDVSQKSTLLAIGFSLPLFLIFMIFPSFFLGIFGGSYVGGSNILRILVVGQMINCLTGAVVVILTMMKLEKKVNIISAIGLSLQILLGIVLTPRYGMFGMAIATFIGTTVLNISGVIILYISHQVNTIPTWNLIRHLGKTR